MQLLKSFNRKCIFLKNTLHICNIMVTSSFLEISQLQMLYSQYHTITH